MSTFSGSNVHKYSPGVLIGNWQDEVAQRDDKLKLYKSQKNYASQSTKREATNPSAMLALTQRLSQPTEVTTLKEGPIPLGKPFLIANVKTGAVLALDLAPLSAPKPGQAVLTANTKRSPQVRSTWELHRCRDEDNTGYNNLVMERNTLHYGQHIRIANTLANPRGFMYVHSELASGRYSTEKQVATAALAASADNVFVVARNATRRQDRHDGQEVQAGEPVVLLHSITNLPLCCDGSSTGTSFGGELRVTCGYALESFSRSRGGVATCEENLWLVSSADAHLAPRVKGRSGAVSLNSTSATAADGIGAVDEATETVLHRIREGALALGGRVGFRALSLSLRVACSEHRLTYLDRKQLHSFIARLGVALLPLELDMLMKHFDRDGDNRVCAQEVVAELRGNMNRTRLDAVVYAFQQLMVEGEGAVEYKDMHNLFSENADYHPDVRDGLITPEEAVKDLEACWPSDILGDKIGIVTLHEFIEYYNDISPETEDDDRFIDMLHNCWAIPETRDYIKGEPHRSVTVKRKDGSYTTIRLPDSLVMDATNREDVRRVLVQLNVRDIADFRVNTRRLQRSTVADAHSNATTTTTNAVGGGGDTNATTS